MHAFGNAEIVSKDIIDFFKCNKVINTMSGLLAVMVLLVWMGMSHRMVTLSFLVTVLGSCSFHRSFTPKPNYLQIFQYICAAALLRRWIARDQMVNGLIETATQSTFWVHVTLLEDVVLVPACWYTKALILGCDDKTLGFCLEVSCF